MGFRHSKGINKHETPKTAKGKALEIKEKVLKEVEDQEIVEVIDKVVEAKEETKKPKVTKKKKTTKTKKTTAKKKKKSSAPKVKSKTE
jgi:hypothetical protein